VAEMITILPDKLAERRQQIETQVAIHSYGRLQAARTVERLDTEIAALESRHAEIVACEGFWQQHETVLKTREGELADPSRKGK